MDFQSVKSAILGNSYVKWGLIAVVACGASFLAGRMSTPEKVTTIEVVKWKEKIVEVEKIVTKKDTSTKEDRDITTTTKEKVNPDGSKEVETVVVDKTKTDNTTSEATTKDTSKTSDKSSETSKTKIVENTRKWHLSVLAGTTPGSLKDAVLYQANPSNKYGGHVEYKVIGDIYVGGFGFSDKSFGVSVGISL
jgi:hypothetical protein